MRKVTLRTAAPPQPGLDASALLVLPELDIPDHALDRLDEMVGRLFLNQHGVEATCSVAIVQDSTPRVDIMVTSRGLDKIFQVTRVEMKHVKRMVETSASAEATLLGRMLGGAEVHVEVGDLEPRVFYV